MTKLDISLPDDVKVLADRRVATGPYQDLRAYVASLIRDDWQRMEQAVVEAKLRERLVAGPANEIGDADFDRIRERLDAEIARRRSQ